MSDLSYWLALNLLPDIGPVLARKLISAFGNPENIFHMSVSDLRQVEYIGENRARSIAGFRQWDVVRREIEGAVRSDTKLVTIHDASYPPLLRNLHDAPLVLYVRGEIKDVDKYAVAIVGSRTPTRYGLQITEDISYNISRFGLTVVSGMARGIDTVSHKGALKARGRTIAVLGSGIDVPYPPENKMLMSSIASSGAVISEFPLGTRPNKENFPRRNRIISALSLGVVVIEATVDSGSLITVGYALEQGRDVFAVPGNITSRNSKGTNDLIKKGAKLVESAEEVIDELKPQLTGILMEDRLISEKKLPMMTDDEKTVYRHLDNESSHIDMIVRKTNMPAGSVLSILLSLELKGVVRQMEGKHFIIHSVFS